MKIAVVGIGVASSTILTLAPQCMQNSESCDIASPHFLQYIIALLIACKVLSLYNRSTLTTNKKAGYAVAETTTQPYPNADRTSERNGRILPDLRPQRRSFLFLVREVQNV